ncbi:MAG: tetratricopeptide repeat protein [Gimesia sp.]
MRRISLAIIFGGCFLTQALPLSAQDKIEVRPDHHVGQATLPCTILNFTHSNVKVKLHPSGKMKTYPSAHIVKVHTPQTKQYQQGLKELQAGQFDKAITAFSEALNIENRSWVRREILALMIKAALSQEDTLKAAIRFQMMVENEPDSRHFELIPLDWTIKESNSPAHNSARRWLIDSDEIKQLMGASILLTDPDYRGQAEATLRSLATSPDINVQQLARTQLWRIRLRADDLSHLELQRWERNLNQVPEHLKAGPYFLLGTGYAMLERHGQAVGSFLWVPLAYDSNPQLSALANLKAAESLLALGQKANALRLYQETIARYPHSSSRQVAEQRIAQMMKRNGFDEKPDTQPN